jgi:ParB family chromosome partitioning protein
MTEKKQDAKALKTPMVAITDIYAPENVRGPGWDSTANLKLLEEDVKKNKVLQPVGVYPYGSAKGPNGEHYELVWGFRRFAVCRRLKHTLIPVRVTSAKLTGRDRFLSKLIENNNREDLAPLDEARAYRVAISEHGMVAKDLAQKLGKTSGFISQRLALLKLPKEIQSSLEEGKISPTHAREIGSVTDEEEQRNLLDKAESMPVSDFRNLVAGVDGDKKKKTNRGRRAKPVGEHPKARSQKEADETLATLDKKILAAKEKDNKVQMNYYKGMHRGITWSRMMDGGKKLF